MAIEGLAGVTAIDTRVAVTEADVEPQTAPSHAVIVTLPGAKPKALPRSDKSSLVIETSVGFEELQVTEARVCWPPPVNVPVAVNFWKVPGVIDGLAGVTVMDANPGCVNVVGV